jgi:ubiquinone/menaquinone biosynthesis C-methylase UbiE
LTAPLERRHLAAKRRLLLEPASGSVLEIGAGTGWSFPHYPDTVEEVAALEPDEGMAARASRRAGESECRITLVRGSAEDLPFEDGSFDWVVSMLVLCTVRDPVAALAEVRRVLGAGGGFLFLEHVRSSEPRRARWQDRLERPWGFVAQGCHPNRDTVAAVQAAGFGVEIVERGELPGAPPIVKPYVLGRATASN